jgi:6-phosphogluconolactonase/glucosamine-6-phosphate isomerase/deaminase
MRCFRKFLLPTDLLKRRAARDHSPDSRLQILPEYRKTKSVALGAGKTCLELLEAYINAAKPAQSTVNRWRVVFTTLDEHVVFGPASSAPLGSPFLCVTFN